MKPQVRKTALKLVPLLCLVAGAVHWGFLNLSGEYLTLQRARKFYHEKKYEESFAQFSLIKKHPLTEIDRRQLIEVALRTQRFALASTLLAEWPYALDEEILRASAGMKDYYGRYREALALYEANAALTTNSYPLSMHRLDLYVRIKDLDRALTETERIITRFPEHEEPRFVRALILSWKGDYGEAEQIASQLVDESPSEKRYLLLRGRIRSWNGDFENALEDYRTVLSREDES